MKTIKCAVVGVGYLGKFHAEKYKKIDACELVTVIDPNEDQGKKIAQELSCDFVKDPSSLIGKVDAVSIASPTETHFPIAYDFLKNDSHVLLEKPICAQSHEAQKLIDMAQEKNKVLQVGHLERFNPVFQNIDKNSISFIKTVRNNPYQLRNTHHSVVLDLMIHDLDLILSLIPHPVKKISAHGIKVFSQTEDSVICDIHFENGVHAQLESHRASECAERKMYILNEEGYQCLDFLTPKKSFYTKEKGLIKEEPLEKVDQLLLEIEHFIHCIQENKTPLVSGVEGKKALVLAEEIQKAVKKNT